MGSTQPEKTAASCLLRLCRNPDDVIGVISADL